MKWIYGVVVIISMASVARAQTDSRKGPFNGNDLLSSCESKGSFEQGVCFGYIEGTANFATATMAKGSKGINGLMFCIPKGIETGQLKDVVTNFLHKYPQSRTYPATVLIVEALSDAFGCKT